MNKDFNDLKLIIIIIMIMIMILILIMVIGNGNGNGNGNDNDNNNNKDFTLVSGFLSDQRPTNWGHHPYYFQVDRDLLHDRKKPVHPRAYSLTSLSEKT